jgi:hypothetical protein
MLRTKGALTVRLTLWKEAPGPGQAGGGGGDSREEQGTCHKGQHYRESGWGPPALGLPPPNGMRWDLTIKNVKHLLHHLLQEVHIRAVLQGGPRDTPATTLAPLHLLRMFCLWILPQGTPCRRRICGVQ